MPISRKRLLIPLGTLLAVILTVGGAVLMADRSSETQVALGSEPDPAEPAQRGPELTLEERTRLFTDSIYLEEFTRQYGPEIAVAVLSESQPATGKDCHYTSHTAGRIAYELYGPQAFSVVGHLCQSGAMHSVVEAVLRDHGTDDLGTDVNAWCENAHRAFFRHNCIHGIGHGLLVWVDYELPEALELCDRLPNEEDRYSCHGGVFMENVRDVLEPTMVMHEQHPERYLRADDPHYPCDVLEERHLAACYFYQSSVMFEHYGAKFEPVAQECAALEESLASWCFRSMGRDLGHQLRENPQGVIDMCSLGPELTNRLDCLEEAVQHRFWETYGADWVLDFCGRLQGADEDERCYWKIAQRATELYETPEEFRQFCARFETGYTWLCDFVLYQQLGEFAEWGRPEWVTATPRQLQEFHDRCVPLKGDEHCELAVFFQLQNLSRQGIPARLD